MTKDEILAEARRRFPIGTKIVSSVGGHNKYEATIEEEVFWYAGKLGISHYGLPWIYWNGKWADVVEEKQPDYQIF